MPPLLEIPRPLWDGLIAHLRSASDGVRESGAFLIGNEQPTRRAAGFLPYEALQADSLNDDYVELHAEAFSKLWARCRHNGFGVVADIHCHRYEAVQSWSDRENPMIAVAGHVALIVPEFAAGDVTPQDLGIYIYQGAHRWTDRSGEVGAVVIVDEASR
jgi:hypothetical protein